MPEMSAYDRMETEGNKSGAYLKMNPTDCKTVKLLTDAVEGINEYEGQKRIEFRFEVLDVSTNEKLIWAVRQKSVMQQISAIRKRFGLNSMIGQMIEINTSGKDSKTKVWFLRLVSNQAQHQMNQGATTGSPTPQQPVDSGQAWLDGQRQGMKAPGSA